MAEKTGRSDVCGGIKQCSVHAGRFLPRDSGFPQVAITFALMTNVVQFAWWTRKKKTRLTHCKKYGPVYLLMLSTCLVM
eukprot:1296210-Amorphochlora_amoeboformis.AAC.2